MRWAISPLITVDDYHSMGYLKTEEYQGSIERKNGAELLAWILDRLTEGWYIYGNADEFYIPGTSAFNIAHFRHPLFLYAYYSTTQTAGGCTYLASKQYGQYEIQIEKLVRAIISQGERAGNNDNVAYEYRLAAARVVDMGIRTFDLVRCASEIRNYLDSAESPCAVGLLSADPIPDAERATMTLQAPCFGTVSVQLLIDVLKYRLNRGLKIDYRATRALAENKSIIRNNVPIWQSQVRTPLARTLEPIDAVARWAKSLHLLCYAYRSNFALKKALFEQLQSSEEILSGERAALSEIHSAMTGELSAL